jgi:potassium efflux system protein
LKFIPVIQSLLLTAMATAGWPVLSGYLGWRVTTSSQVSEFTLAVGEALSYAAGLLWLSGFVRLLCRNDGVADTFFNWPQSGLKVGRNAVGWLTWCGVPLASVVVVAQTYRQGEWDDSIGRLAFVCAMWLLAAFTQATLGLRNNVFREAIAKDPNGWLSRMRVVAYTAGIVIPLTLSVMAIVGYYYSAQQLAIRLQATLGMALVILLVHAVASRWFVVKRRRLAMEQSRERQLALQAAQEAGAESGEGASALPPVKDATDWTAVHERLQLLLRQAVTVGVVLGGWLIWSDVLPALRILDNVELWSKSVEVVERFEDTDGKVRPVTALERSPTTLRHAMIAGMILLATVILGRNLPALLEITVLSRLPLDRGGRHAVSIILHYAVALTGLIVALRTLNIDWASVQWLAAGITVGLGFGLQEIFANFVSGMILLFERPIRVGDIITLGDVTGSVSSIRIRATTVTNWDRKELIVPNKDLVTGRLLNWTLSDTTNRIVIELAIPFHSDAGRARKLMEQVVAGHPHVLADPAPSVTFESFTDGTLKFVIRAYLASLEVRQQTVHDLHVTLHQRLQSEGIGIALPQRDVNVRGAADPAAHLLYPERVAAARRGDAA